MTAEQSQRPPMTFEQYLDFLDEYWEIFGPPRRREPAAPYHTVLL